MLNSDPVSPGCKELDSDTVFVSVKEDREVFSQKKAPERLVGA